MIHFCSCCWLMISMSFFEFLISAVHKPRVAVFPILVGRDSVALVSDGHLRFLSLYVCDVQWHPTGRLNSFAVERLDSGNP